MPSGEERELGIVVAIIVGLLVLCVAWNRSRDRRRRHVRRKTRHSQHRDHPTNGKQVLKNKCRDHVCTPGCEAWEQALFRTMVSSRSNRSATRNRHSSVTTVPAALPSKQKGSTATFAPLIAQPSHKVVEKGEDRKIAGLITHTPSEWANEVSVRNKMTGAKFDSIWPDGIVIGRLTGRNLKFTRTTSVRRGLLFSGPPAWLAKTKTDPTVTSQTGAGALVAEFLACLYNIALDNDGLLGASGMSAGQFQRQVLRYTGNSVDGCSLQQIVFVGHGLLSGADPDTLAYAPSPTELYEALYVANRFYSKSSSTLLLGSLQSPR